MAEFFETNKNFENIYLYMYTYIYLPVIVFFFISAHGVIAEICIFTSLLGQSECRNI